jgi:pyruvate kinase
MEQNLAKPGDRLIVTAGVPVGTPGTTNLLKVIEIEPNTAIKPQAADMRLVMK